MLDVPTGRSAFVNVAVPPTERVPLPRSVPPCLKRTVPVGVPEPDVTVAVKVTGCMKMEGFAEVVSVVIVAFAASGFR